MMADQLKTYTITEAATISGLPESTLRYYETIGIIRPIKRDPGTKRRTYSDDDINLVVAIACLNATGLAIDDMRAYLQNSHDGATGAAAQVALLQGQLDHLTNELRYAQLRIRYVESKVAYWQAIERQDETAVAAARRTAYAAADAMKLPKPLTRT